MNFLEDEFSGRMTRENSEQFLEGGYKLGM